MASSAAQKRAHPNSDAASNGMDDVVHRTTSRTTATATATSTAATTATATASATTTVTTVTTTVVTTTATAATTTATTAKGSTKETAIHIDSDPDIISTGKPVKKKSKRSHDARGSYPCGCKKWVQIPDELIDAYEVSVCRICSRHPNSKCEVYMFAHFVHEEGGDYECPYGDCEGNVRYLCYECRRRNP